MLKRRLILGAIVLIAAASVAIWQALEDAPCNLADDDCKMFYGKPMRLGSRELFGKLMEGARQSARDREARKQLQLAIDLTLPRIRQAKLHDKEGEFRVSVKLNEGVDSLKWVEFYQGQGATFVSDINRETGEVDADEDYFLMVNKRIISTLAQDDLVYSVQSIPEGTRASY
jgi:hypothetical protein